GVANHVTADVIVSRYQQQGERDRNRDRRGYAQRRQQEHESNPSDDGQRITSLDEHHGRSNSEDCVLEILVARHFERARLQARDPRRFRVRSWCAAVRTETDTWGYVCSATRTGHGV